ncbi:MAG: hypothetical protein JSW04_05160 [Desulfobacterales bacterium]|nr:MAG: hypothetical protein JSW04_05160 [Desulfobacterales bacterium]
MLNYIQFGLGPIGEKIVSYAIDRENLCLVGAIDIDKSKVDQDVGQLIGTRPLGIRVSSDVDDVLKNAEADIVLLSTVSSLAALEEQILRCIRYGKNVVSSSEELAFPWIENRKIAETIDKEARKHRVTVIGTGVNPGFVMDALPIFLTSACQKVHSIRIERYQDASIRRRPFQEKIGAGLSLKEFMEKVSTQSIRHVGFTESIQMIAYSMGWELDRTEDIVEPVVADNDVASHFIKVKKGEVVGICQTGRGFINGNTVITLELQAYLGHTAPKDAVIIEGEPSMQFEVKGGVNGDIATCAMVVNAMPKVLQASPGLKTMPEIGLVSWFKGYR